MRPKTEKLIDDFFVRCPDLAAQREDVLCLFETLRDAFAGGHKLLACGNGGSAADSEHIVGELMKGFQLMRPLPAEEKDVLSSLGEDGAMLAEKLQQSLTSMSLCGHPSLATAFGNDVDPVLVFAQQAYAYARPKDVVLGITTSGNSRNILLALTAAKARGAVTAVLTGEGGGKAARLADVTVRVPGHESCAVQENYMRIYHILCLALEAEFFDE